MDNVFYNSPVVITLPRVFAGEAELLKRLLGAGAGIIHIRKPESTGAELEGLLGRLAETGVDMTRFTLHYDEPLARRYGLGGVHLRGGDLAAGAGEGLRRSCSAHSWDEVRTWSPAADYIFLSPLFDSISKAGYRSGIDITQVPIELTVSGTGRVVALGGIASGNIARVRAAGFAGAAVLGSVWAVRDGVPDAAETVRNFQRLNRKWRAAGGKLQFISDGNMAVAAEFLEGGGRWIQLRMKDAPAGAIVSRGREMLALCRKYDAVLLLNDNPALAAEIGADGVHLGRGDMAPAEARRIMGAGAIIGSTANTFGHIAEIAAGTSDYIGLGPFRYTTTKKNLSPILGLDGYRGIIRRMREAGIHIPVVAIGGIELDDVSGIMDTGVTGIALSGAVSRAADIKQTTVEFLNKIK